MAQNKKLLKRPENTECINKLQLIPKMEKYTAVKMHGLQLNTALCESQEHTAVGGFGCVPQRGNDSVATARDTF